MGGKSGGRALQVGRLIVIVIGIIFATIAVGVAVTPLPGEEAYAGTTFAELQSSNPRIANIIWHDYVAFGILFLGVSVLIVLLAWQGLSPGSRLVWSSLVLLGITILAFLVLAHVPIGHTDPLHFGLPLLLAVVLLIGLALSASSVFSGARETAR